MTESTGTITKTKRIMEFKRGDPIPVSAKYLSSREQVLYEWRDGGHCLLPDYEEVVGRYWVDVYEVYND